MDKVLKNVTSVKTTIYRDLRETQARDRNLIAELDSQRLHILKKTEHKNMTFLSLRKLRQALKIWSRAS